MRTIMAYIGAFALCLMSGAAMATTPDPQTICTNAKIEKCDLEAIHEWARVNGHPTMVKLGEVDDATPPISSEGRVCNMAVREGARALWLCLPATSE